MGRFPAAILGIIAIGLAVVAGYLILPGSSPPTVAPTGLIADRAIHDFGMLGQKETVTAAFRLTNREPCAIEVVEVLKSCSCAEAHVRPERLETGESAVLTVTWEIGAWRGAVANAVYVKARTLDDRDVPVQLGVKLLAEIEPDIHFEPAELRFEHGQAKTINLQFRPGRLPDARILSAKTTTPGLTASVNPAAGTVEVSYDPARFILYGQPARVDVETTSTKEPTVSVAVVVVETQSK